MSELIMTGQQYHVLELALLSAIERGVHYASADEIMRELYAATAVLDEIKVRKGEMDEDRGWGKADLPPAHLAAASEIDPPKGWRKAIEKVRGQLGQAGGTGTAGVQNSITEREVGGWVLDAVEDELSALAVSTRPTAQTEPVAWRTTYADEPFHWSYQKASLSEDQKKNGLVGQPLYTHPAAVSEIDPLTEFGAWLTTRDKVIEVGGATTVYAMWEALTEFCAMKRGDDIAAKEIPG